MSDKDDHVAAASKKAAKSALEVCIELAALSPHWFITGEIVPNARQELAELRAEKEEAKQEECRWSVDPGWDEDDVWTTECEKDFLFSDGGPKENGFKFCPYCGGAIALDIVPEKM